MNNVNPSDRAPFFPSKNGPAPIASKTELAYNTKNTRRKSGDDKQALNEIDSSVDIPKEIRDFSRIKRAVDQAPEIDNTEKVAQLKDQIKSGTYTIDYDALAEKILQQET